MEPHHPWHMPVCVWLWDLLPNAALPPLPQPVTVLQYLFLYSFGHAAGAGTAGGEFGGAIGAIPYCSLLVL